ncbi:MAG TPA: hypothetical protein VEX68_07630, partial [Bryobacteraceae bacterium]|nr:hypothetical protein [Bryobacteraceae bacterium]
RPEYFVSGTQPVEMCRLHGGGGTQVAGWETTPAPSAATAAAVPATPQTAVSDQGRPYRAQAPPPSVPMDTPQSGEPPAPSEKTKEKKGFFGKIKDIFK